MTPGVANPDSRMAASGPSIGDDHAEPPGLTSDESEVDGRDEDWVIVDSEDLNGQAQCMRHTPLTLSDAEYGCHLRSIHGLNDCSRSIVSESASESTSAGEVRDCYGMRRQNASRDSQGWIGYQPSPGARNSAYTVSVDTPFDQMREPPATATVLDTPGTIRENGGDRNSEGSSPEFRITYGRNGPLGPPPPDIPDQEENDPLTTNDLAVMPPPTKKRSGRRHALPCVRGEVHQVIEVPHATEYPAHWPIQEKDLVVVEIRPGQVKTSEVELRYAGWWDHVRIPVWHEDIDKIYCRSAASVQHARSMADAIRDWSLGGRCGRDVHFLSFPEDEFIALSGLVAPFRENAEVSRCQPQYPLGTFYSHLKITRHAFLRYWALVFDRLDAQLVVLSALHRLGRLARRRQSARYSGGINGGPLFAEWEEQEMQPCLWERGHLQRYIEGAPVYHMGSIVPGRPWRNYIEGDEWAILDTTCGVPFLERPRRDLQPSGSRSFSYPRDVTTYVADVAEDHRCALERTKTAAQNSTVTWVSSIEAEASSVDCLRASVALEIRHTNGVVEACFARMHAMAYVPLSIVVDRQVVWKGIANADSCSSSNIIDSRIVEQLSEKGLRVAFGALPESQSMRGLGAGTPDAVHLWAGLQIDLGYGPIEVPFKVVPTNGIILLGGVFLCAHSAHLCWKRMELTLRRPCCRVGVRDNSPRLLIPPLRENDEVVIEFAQVQEAAEALALTIPWEKTAQVKPTRFSLPEDVRSLDDFVRGQSKNREDPKDDRISTPAHTIDAYAVNVRKLNPGEDAYLTVRLTRSLEPGQSFWPIQGGVAGVIPPEDDTSAYDETNARCVVVHVVNTNEKEVLIKPDTLVCVGLVVDDGPRIQSRSSPNSTHEETPVVAVDLEDDSGVEESKTESALEGIEHEARPEPDPPPDESSALLPPSQSSARGIVQGPSVTHGFIGRGRNCSSWHLVKYDELCSQFSRVGSVPIVRRRIAFLFAGVGMGAAGALKCNKEYWTLYQPTLAIDCHPAVLEIHKASFPDITVIEFRIGVSHKALQNAIAEVIPRELWESTLVVLTPDCRTASRANFWQRDLPANARLTKHAYRSIARARPRFLGFVMEQTSDLHSAIANEVPNSRIVNLRNFARELMSDRRRFIASDVPLNLPRVGDGDRPTFAERFGAKYGIVDGIGIQTSGWYECRSLHEPGFCFTSSGIRLGPRYSELRHMDFEDEEVTLGSAGIIQWPENSTVGYRRRLLAQVLPAPAARELLIAHYKAKPDDVLDLRGQPLCEDLVCLIGMPDSIFRKLHGYADPDGFACYINACDFKDIRWIADEHDMPRQTVVVETLAPNEAEEADDDVESEDTNGTAAAVHIVELTDAAPKSKEGEGWTSRSNPNADSGLTNTRTRNAGASEVSNQAQAGSSPELTVGARPGGGRARGGFCPAPVLPEMGSTVLSRTVSRALDRSFDGLSRQPVGSNTSPSEIARRHVSCITALGGGLESYLACYGDSRA